MQAKLNESPKPVGAGAFRGLQTYKEVVDNHKSTVTGAPALTKKERRHSHHEFIQVEACVGFCRWHLILYHCGRGSFWQNHFFEGYGPSPIDGNVAGPSHPRPTDNMDQDGNSPRSDHGGKPTTVVSPANDQAGM
ncbi:hypothetical protein Ancab_033548 [Ancistrocladus abbreviatus]